MERPMATGTSEQSSFLSLKREVENGLFKYILMNLNLINDTRGKGKAR